MKTVRVLLLVLVAVLLPLRGALAEALHCPVTAGSQSMSSLAGAPGEAHRALDHAAPVHGTVHDAEQGLATAHGHDHDHLADAQAQEGHGAHTFAAVEACKHCPGSCSATPLMAAAVSVAPPLLASLRLTPALDGPPSSHRSAGPERPPRIS